ncbi:MAG: DUF3857 domain-containing protein [Pseudomonadota bacterium]
MPSYPRLTALAIALAAAALPVAMTPAMALPIAAPAVATTDDSSEELLLAPIPAWVEVADIPDQTDATLGLAMSEALHSDQYLITDTGGITYQRLVTRISDRSALESQGTVSIEWVPGRSVAMVHHLKIIRGDTVIDILQKQDGFATFQREANLAEGIIDGQVTASIQIEDLRVGDVIDFAHSIETAYSPMTGHYQTWHYFTGRTRADRLIQRIVWPKDREIFLDLGEDLPEMPETSERGYRVRKFSTDNVDWEEMPDNLMSRYYRSRGFLLSTFRSWEELSGAFLPVYEAAMTIPDSGPLRDYVETVRALDLSRKETTERVLQMVQTDIRYVGNFQGLGNYTPVSAQSVWDSRFGDCKGKTVLLTAILRELGVDATPVMVHTNGNDALEDTIVMPGWFNHVFVRARIDGQTYWLDGTRQDDSSLDRLPPVFYDYAVPLEAGAGLIALTDDRYDRPQQELVLEMDARAGLDRLTPITMTVNFYDDNALSLARNMENMTEADRAKILTDLASKSEENDIRFRDFDVQFDIKGKYARMVFTGEADLVWGDAQDFRELDLKQFNIGRNFYSERDDEDYRDVPLFTGASYKAVRVELQLPEGTKAVRINGGNYDRTIGPAHYFRSFESEGNIVRGYMSTNIRRSEYLPAEAKRWDEESDKLFEDSVSVAVFNGSSDAAIRFATYDDAIAEAQSLAQNDDIGAALAMLDPLIASDPNQVDLLVARGAIGDDMGRRERDLLRALLLDPYNMGALRAASELYIAQDNRSLSRKMLDRMLNKDEDDAWAKEQREALRLRAIDDEERREAVVAASPSS